MGHKLNPLNIRLNYNYLPEASAPRLTSSIGTDTFKDIEIKKYINSIFKANGCFLGYFSLKQSKDAYFILATYIPSTFDLGQDSEIGLYYKMPKQVLKHKNKTMLFMSNNMIHIDNASLLTNTLKLTGIQNHYRKLRSTLLYVILSDLNKYTNKYIYLWLQYSLEPSKNIDLLINFLESRFVFVTQGNSFTKITRYFIKNLNKLYIAGVKLKGSGRLEGQPMADSYEQEIGCIPNSYVTSKLNYRHVPVHTKYGTCGIKLWICHR